MKTPPRISVLMPVYNVAAYVQGAIDSILNQSYKDFELLIINDGSTDATRDEVLKFTDPRIRFVENEHNIGLANTLNRGIELATGEYIARMDGDDISLPDRLKKQADMLDRHLEIDICGAGYRFFGSKNYEVHYPRDHESIKAGLLFGCCMIIPMFRKESVIKANLRYDQAFFPAEDYRFWTQCVTKLKLYNIPETLFLYRMHPAQVSETRTDQSQMTMHVRTLYFQSLFPTVDSQFTTKFVSNLIDPVERIEDFQEHIIIANSMIAINIRQKSISHTELRMLLRHHLKSQLADFINKYWFASHFSLKGLFYLFSTGLFWRLPLKFRNKLIIKCVIMKRAIK